MTEDYRSPGKTTLAPDVLLTISRMSALGVEGVSRMAPIPGGFDRLFRRGADDGVQHLLLGTSEYFSEFADGRLTSVL